ncbi:hypothetical protein CL620_06345, partial [archaeon]|nr:hypothetical protein [archaeon]
MTSTIQKTFLVLLLILITINIALAATKTFRGEETDFFKLSPETFDLDGDQVTVTYSEPFDEQGEWQTTYGDAGEYRVIITASDGQEETTDEVLFIVSKKNRAPEIIEPKLAVKESQKVSLRDAVRDPDDDPLTFQFQPPFNQQGEWQTGYDDEGIIVTQFSVSDGEFTTQGRVEVQVLPTNQPPIITSTFSTEKKLDVTEGDTLGFSVEAEDRDGDAITYAWFIDDDLITERAQGQYHFDFESAGEHTLKVIVNDGTRESSREWEITVRNVNREPAFSIQPITVNEGERAELKFPTQDLDGDALSYTFEKPLVDGKWQTGFEDAGTHRVTVTATDGEFTKRQDVIITVLDVDRPPSLTLPSSLLAKEGETLEWGIVTEDPDGDVVTISIENMPDGAVLHQRSKTFLWNLDYDAIQRKGGFWSDLLSAVRLEKYFLKEKTIPLTVKVCGKDLCNEGEVVLYVKNVNQNPIINPLDDVRVIETEEVSLNASGSDPDGDIVRFSYTDPVNHNGEWKTGYEDEGTYTVFVTASD